jgi:hypothetical protein
MSVYGWLLARIRVCGTVRIFQLELTLEDAIHFHAFAPLEALPSV